MGKYAGKGTELRGTAWQFPEAAAGRLLFMHFIRQICCRNRQRGKSVENKEEHMAIFEGAGVAIITPFHEDGSVNYEKFGEHIEAQIAGGTDAIIVCGTTGEASTLTHEEHLDVIRYCVKKDGGQDSRYRRNRFQLYGNRGFPFPGGGKSRCGRSPRCNSLL